MWSDDNELRGHPVGPGRQVYLVGKRHRVAAPNVESDETQESFHASERPSLLALKETLEGNEDTQVRRVIGPHDDPDMLVVEMFSEHAEQLKSEHPDLIVEEDASLNIL